MNIIVGRNGKETVGKLSTALSADTYSKHFTRRSEFWRKNGCKMRIGYTPSVGGVTINWAINPSEVAYDGIVYNEHGIGLSSNKPKARAKMYRDGVSVPKTTTDKDEALRWVREGTTIVCRPASHHSGQNFFVIRPTTSGIDVNSIMSLSDYYSEYFPKVKEYRAHCGHGKILVLQEKVPTVEGFDKSVEAPWNHATGMFVFKTMLWNDYPIRVCKESLDAVKSMGLDFGAVDVLMDANGAVAICEVNTSPSLEDYCTERYVKYFNWLNNSQTKRKHWDYSGYTKGKSYAWKNNQLDGSFRDTD